MIACCLRCLRTVVFYVVVLSAGRSLAPAQEPVQRSVAQDPQTKQIMRKASAYLRTQLSGITSPDKLGELALGTLALIKADEHAKKDPVVRQALAVIRGSCAGGTFAATMKGGKDNYVAAVVIMCLIAADHEEYFDEIQTVSRYLLAKQTEFGAWDYDSGNHGDTSMTQYGVLALWEAVAVGVDVPPKVWDNALKWLAITQSTDGGFTYHPNYSPGGARQKQGGIKHTMTVAGAGSAIICRAQLPHLIPQRRRDKKQIDLLTLVRPKTETQESWEPKTTKAESERTIQTAENWMNSNMTISEPVGPLLYYLYGLERYGTLAERDEIGGVNWYQAGKDFLASTQQADGSWKGCGHEGIPDASFAVLFLARSTLKTISRMRVLQVGRGTLVGGRGIPTNELPTGIASRVKPRYRAALKSPVEDLLKALEDPDFKELESAAVALETADSEKLARAVKGDTKQLRALARSKQPQIRRAALWALARTKDYRVVPVLIAALSDPDNQVYLAARNCLRFISRRVDGVGLPEDRPESAQQIVAGAKRWKEWFDSLRVELDPDQLYDEPAGMPLGND